MPSLSQMVLPTPKSEDEFEDICVDVLNCEYDKAGFVLYGRRGQKQFGIDAFCDASEGKRIVAQCKNYKATNEFITVVRQDFETAKKTFDIKKFIVMTSLDIDRKIQDFISELKEECSFEIEMWFWDRITKKICNDYSLYEKYYSALPTPIKIPTRIEPFNLDFFYIARSVVPCSYSNSDESVAVSFGRTTSLTEELKEHKKIILTGEAGGGKSIELQKLYNEYYDSKNMFSLFLSLKDSPNEIINKTLSYAGKNINGKIPFFIIDGLDEVQPDKRSEFIKQIKFSFSNCRDDYVVISAREYFVADLEGFKKYRLTGLSYTDIKCFVEEKGIPHDSFRSCLISSKCDTIARIPFYLIYLVKIYQEPRKLPPKTQLMDSIVEYRINADIEKYDPTTTDLKNKKVKLKKYLYQISIAMQLLKEYSLNEDDYQELFEDDTMRGYLAYWGGFANRKDGEKWEFEHNNFREYLAAKYLVILGLDAMLDIITYDEEKRKLRPSWFNVVEYLAAMLNESDLTYLVAWLIENEKECLYNLEDAYVIDDVKKTEIFIGLMNESVDKGLYLHALVNDQDKMAIFCQCKAVIEYVKKTLDDTQSEHAIFNSLRALARFDEFYGFENELINIILERYIKACSDEYQIQCAIYAVSNICKDNLSGILELLFPLINETVYHGVASAFIDLVNEAKEADKYIDFIIKANEKKYNSSYYGSISLHIETALESISTFDSISKCIAYFAEDEENTLCNSDKIFTHLCSKATELYHSGRVEIFEIMFEAFLRLEYRWHSQTSDIRKFFADTGTLGQAIERLFTTDFDWQTLDSIMGSDTIDVLEKEWLKSDKHNEAVKICICRLPHDSEELIRLSAFAKKYKGIDIPKKTAPVDWNKINREGNQKYFDSLFNKEVFEGLLKEIIQIAGCEDVVGKKLFSLRRDIPNERKDLDVLRFAVGRWCGDGKVVDYLNNTTWEYFSFVKICSAFKNNQKELIISDMQREIIKPYCEKEFDNLNFANCKGNEYFNFAPFLVFAVINFNFCCDDERLLKMLYLPPHLFYNNSSSWETALIEFVIDKFSDKERLRRVILDPSKLQTLNLSYKKNFVAYCSIKKLQNAVDVVVELLSDGSKISTDKQFLVDYLLDIKGQKYIDDKIVTNADVELLGIIANKVKDDMPNLMQRLEDENEKSKDKRAFLSELIKFNSPYGLKKYLEIAKSSNTIPDYSEEGVTCTITDSIERVNNPDLLDYICELIKLSHTEGFRDESNRGLKTNLGNAIRRIALIDTNNYVRVKTALIDIRDSNSDNGKLTSYCNWHLESLSKEMNIKNDVPWKIEKIKKYLKETEG